VNTGIPSERIPLDISRRFSSALAITSSGSGFELQDVARISGFLVPPTFVIDANRLRRLDAEFCYADEFGIESPARTGSPSRIGTGDTIAAARTSSSTRNPWSSAICVPATSFSAVTSTWLVIVSQLMTITVVRCPNRHPDSPPSWTMFAGLSAGRCAK